MSDLPTLTPEQIENAIPAVSNVERVGQGGQKVVFKATVEGEAYALKIALVPEVIETDEDEGLSSDVVSARAEREVSTMRECPSEYMVKLGPIGLNFATIEGQSVLYFTEEFVSGKDLKAIIEEKGRLPAGEVVRLGLNITDAISGLWDLGKVHRDIKPGNIMWRETSDDYILLDAGLAFDVVGESLSKGHVVGTLIYFSPEQFDYTTRRALDFRSDMFSLGVTMYQAATGQHPFWTRGESSGAVFSKILLFDPKPPSSLTGDEDFPEALDDIILQMLGKSQHLRFRTCDRLIEALRGV